MDEKDAPTKDEPKSEEHPKREQANPRERSLSFMKQRRAVLRPRDELAQGASEPQQTEQEDAKAEEERCAPGEGERQKLLAQYRRRQRKK
jgi:hypothetical protein